MALGQAGSGINLDCTNASVAPAERIVCRREIPVGSNIPKRLCRLAKDVEETSTFHREQLRRSLH